MSIYITYSNTNPGITCAPLCVSSVSSRYVPSTKCPSKQDQGLCGLIAATNIQTISGYSQWSCTAIGAPLTPPCTSSPVWNGLACAGNNAISLSVSNVGLTGNGFNVNKILVMISKCNIM